VLADESVPVPPGVRRELAQNAWNERDEGTNYEKGRRLEALLAFLLGQVDDFIVKDRSFRGETDEIDIVLQIGKFTSRCWFTPGSPFVLVEAKNWAIPVNQKEISAFIVKLQTMRGRTKLGFFFAKSGFTSDAEQQELKLAATEYSLVLLGPGEIVEWINSTDPDDYLETKVRHAILR
jgi:hypothetical protein